MLEMKHLPKPETMLTYASILEKPKYQVDEKTGIKYRLATGEIVEAACAALRYCATLKAIFEADSAPPEAAFDNADDMLAWLNDDAAARRS